MKKLYLILLLIVATLFCSCSQQSSKTQPDNTYNFETDMQYYYRNQCYVYPMTASDSGYYVVGDRGIVIYIDKKSMKATPLCNKPNCKHNDPDTCNSYLVNTAYDKLDIALDSPLETAIQYYRENLYTIDFEYNNDRESYEPFLVRYNLDGTKYTKITDNISGVPALVDWFIHRGYFYYVTDHRICRIPMDSPKSKAETVYELKDYFEETNNISELKAYGDYIYFKANTDINNETESYKTKKFFMNINTLDSKEATFENENVNVMTFYNGKAIFIASGNGATVNYYSADLNMENPSLLTTQKLGNMLSSDGKYMYIDNGNKFTYSNEKNKKEKYLGQTIHIYDADMNEADSFIFPSKTVYPYIGGHDEDNFLVFMPDDNGSYMLSYISKSQIGSFNEKAAELKELCKLNWTENTSDNYIAE